ncbi:unnamed protein product [Musa acuminata subsp. burmannicoides]
MARPLDASSPLGAPGVAWLTFAIQLHLFLLVVLFVCCYLMVAIVLYIAIGAALGWCKRRAKRSAAMAFAATIPRAVYVVPSSSSSSPAPPSSTSVSAVVPQTVMESCIICMEEFVSGEELWVLPRCKHWFHGECIRRWLLVPSMTCPICRMLMIGVEVRPGRSLFSSTINTPFLVPMCLILSVITSLIVIIAVHT